MLMYRFTYMANWTGTTLNEALGLHKCNIQITANQDTSKGKASSYPFRVQRAEALQSYFFQGIDVSENKIRYSPLLF